MLKKMKLKNYVTFLSETVFDFEATSYKFLEKTNVTEEGILKGALFIGGNASGKSKVLEAIKLLLDLLLSNNEISLNKYKSLYTVKDECSFSYEFIINSKLIEYSFVTKGEKIVTEKLFLDKKILVERMGKVAKFNLKSEKTIENIPDKILVLRSIYFDTKFYNDEILNNWFDFMKKTIFVDSYERTILSYQNDAFLIDEYLKKYGPKKINDFLKEVNADLSFEKNKGLSEEVKKIVTKDSESDLVLVHKDGLKFSLPLSIESLGNVTLANILPAFLYAISNDSMIIIDEFSSGFHNKLEEMLIKYFFSNSNKSQIFFNSHSTNLLKNTILRPDQVYVLDLCGAKGSLVTRISDEKPRELQNIEKMYLNGVFGGLPYYKE